MDVSEVLSLLAANRDDRGITNRNKMAAGSARLSTFGIGLSRLRQLAKQVGRNRELALKLWQTDLYDARVIALPIDDPAAITREQAESQVHELGDGQLTHVFSSCGSSLARTPFVVELVDAWTVSPDRTRRSCGYGLLSEVAQCGRRRFGPSTWTESCSDLMHANAYTLFVDHRLPSLVDRRSIARKGNRLS